MQTFDQRLTDLVQKGIVSCETAKAAASNPSDFELRMKMFSRLSHAATSDDVVADEAATGPATGAPAHGIPSGDRDLLTSS